MSPFEYMMMFFAIILGLGVADMLQSLHKLLVSPGVRWHWLPPLWAAAIFLTLLGFWIVNFDLDVGTGPIRYLRGSILSCLMFLLSSAALPDVEAEFEPGQSLREHFERRHRYVGTLWITFLAGALLALAAVGVQWDYKAWALGGLLVLAVPTVLTRNVWYHTIFAVCLIANAFFLILR